MRPSFKVIVQPSYYERGWLYIPTAYGHDFRSGEIKIRLPERELPVYADVDKAPGQTWTLGGSELRDWFREQLHAKDEVLVRVQSTYCIDIAPV
ncbi:MAG: hypothetical protein OXG82_14665 [Gammaproteobacteria bacterium]|nr:hypothetical protein [Gammaproteobacteria bacterium]